MRNKSDLAGPATLETQFQSLLASAPDVEFIDLMAQNRVVTKRSVYQYFHMTGSAKSGEGHYLAFNKIIEALVERHE